MQMMQKMFRWFKFKWTMKKCKRWRDFKLYLHNAAPSDYEEKNNAKDDGKTGHYQTFNLLQIMKIVGQIRFEAFHMNEYSEHACRSKN